MLRSGYRRQGNFSQDAGEKLLGKFRFVEALG